MLLVIVLGSYTLVLLSAGWRPAPEMYEDGSGTFSNGQSFCIAHQACDDRWLSAQAP